MSSDETPNPSPPHAPVNLWPREPTPTRVPDPTRDFFIGLSAGLIPLLFLLIGIGSHFHVLSSSIRGNLVAIGGLLYLAGIGTTIILVSVRATRRLGLGLLTALAADLVIVFVAYVAALTSGPV
jgi:hypothetical protein